MPAPSMHAVTFRQIAVNGIRLHVAVAGEGPLVVLLHGFPEFWYSWRHQLAALAAAGFQAVAPDLRGYNLSAKPPRVRDYRLRTLVADIADLIGTRQAIVVGHDWGGVIAWKLAMERPDLVARLAILNAPHPVAFARALRAPAQWLRSSYILFFQLPWLPECLIAADNFALLDRVLRRQPVHREAFLPEDVLRYKAAFAQPGALTGALNYYRALARYPHEIRDGVRPINVPTLLLWGERDPYLGVDMTEHLERWVPQLHVARIPDASHWVQNDAPERVNQRLVDFLR